MNFPTTGFKDKIMGLALLVAVVPLLFFWHPASAANTQLSNRSITINTSVPSATANHVFKFDIFSASNIGSIELEYCTNSPFPGQPCTVPAGLSLNLSTLSNQTGQTGFSIHPNSTSNKMILTRPVAAASPGTVSYTLSNVINPSSLNQSVFVRLSTYASTDASGPITDEGGVVFGTTSGLSVGGYVPPFLILCVGVTVTADCSGSAGSLVDLGLLTPSQTKSATTQFAGATNDFTGYSVFSIGTTMTSGNNIITPNVVPTASSTGSAQFGINLRANSSPSIGANPSGNGTNTPAANYNIPNRYMFSDGDLLAQSSKSTDFNVFTVSYVVNVPVGQAAGLYNTTITFLATASF